MSQVLKQDVLILNKYYMAVQVSIVSEAIKALVKEVAVVVDEDYITYDLEQWKQYTGVADEEIMGQYTGLVRSPSTRILAPQVVRFTYCEYTSPLIKTVKYSRRNIYKRDKHTCQYCLNKRIEFKEAVRQGQEIKKILNLDHVIPRARGGKSSWTNIVTSCVFCNAEKGDRLLKELGWTLYKQASKPKWDSHVGTPFEKTKNHYWERFLTQ